MMTSTGTTGTHFSAFSDQISIVILEDLLYSFSKISIIERDDPFWIVFTVKLWAFKIGEACD